MGKLTVTAGLCLVIASLVSVSTASTAHSTKLVCHFNLDAKNRADHGRFTVSDINPNLCTHLIFASADIDNQNELAYNDPTEEEYYWSCNGLKNRNPNLKTLLAVGCSTFDTNKFITVVATAASRQTFIDSTIRLLRYYGFDGLNIDWRYPGSAYKDKFTLLCQELKQAFLDEVSQTGRDSLIVTASVSAVKATIDASYEVPQIAASLEFFNVMAYDFGHSSEAATYHHSPSHIGSLDNGDDMYLNAAFAMSYWTNLGAPKYKLNLGCAAYGKTFELSSAFSSHLGASVNGPGEEGSYTSKAGFLAYYEICHFLPGATIQFIDDQKVPFATKGNQWVGYDNENSIAYKVKYIEQNGFGGAFLASLDLDDFSGHFCNQGNYPFTSHLHSLLIPGFPNLCTGKANGLYPNPLDASTYYNCWNGAGHIQKCPGNLVFVQYSQSCDYPTTTPTENPCYGRLYGLYPHPRDLHCYYNCGHGIAHLQCCPANLVFKSSCQCCDYQTTTHTGNPCFGKPDGLVSNSQDQYSYYKCINGNAHLLYCPSYSVFHTSGCVYPTQIPNHCHGKPSGYYANYNDVHSYYHCDDGINHLIYCPSNLVFQQSCRCCAHPTTTPTGIPCNGLSNGLLPYPGDDHCFYHCSNGIAYKKRCPANLVFKPSCHCCDFPIHTPTGNPIVNCIGMSNGYYAYTYDPHSFYNCVSGNHHFLVCPNNYVYRHSSHCCVYGITNRNGKLCNNQESGHFPYPHDPHYFYNCAHGIAYLQKCPSNLVWEPINKCCTYPPSTNTGFCYGKLSGHYAHPANPHAFYQCDHGITHLKYCTSNLVWEPINKCCTYPPSTSTGFCSGKPSGHYAHPSNPNAFYQCDHGITYLKYCASNLVWEPINKCCTYPPSTSTGFCSGKPSGHYAHPSNPNAFYQCDHGITYLKYCASNLVWEPINKCCTFPPSTNTGPCSGKENGLYTHPNGLSYYYNCWNGQHYSQKCPGNLVFSHDFQSCEHPTTTPPANPCHGKAHRLYPNPHDPHCYYNCGHGIAHLQCCPANLVFRSSCQCCDYDTTTPVVNPCNGQAYPYLPNPNNPYSFFRCVNGHAYLQTCPSYSIFQSNQCVYPTPPANHCHGKPSGFYANHYNAGSYYHCDHGITHTKNCASGSVFEQSCHCCVHPTTTPTAAPCNGLSNGLLPYPGDDHCFYHCSNGIAYKKRCPANLVFNPSCRCCDYPTSTTTPTPTPTYHCNVGNNGYQLYLQRSPMFYHCVGGVSQSVYCPTDYYYEPSTHCCVYGP